GQVVLAVSAAAAAAGTAIGLYRLDYERIPRVGLLSAAFFAASLFHLPLGPATVHLTLIGLMGLVLGWAAFPAVLVALSLQAVFLPFFGGYTTLGLNTLIMATPAVVCHYLFRRALGSDSEVVVFRVGFAAAAIGILLGASIGGLALLATGKAFEVFGYGFLIAHVPLALLEGVVTGSVVVLLRKACPELLEAPTLVPTTQELAHG
ncbi:MAG TPA: cobalt transporter CbiM, partial [Thermoguttaceae bacterium]|nr:cobalt transporter CbiM [Thermoguttaceae bacterium]